MNIVILGAGLLGRHVASILSEEEHDVTLIDMNVEKLALAEASGDVGVREGDATNWRLMEELLDVSPDMFLALTGNDSVNLVATSIAKVLGYPMTLARVRDEDYVNTGRLDFKRMFHADHLLDPEHLVAHSIFKTLVDRDYVAAESFAHGAVQLRTIVIPEKWKLGNQPLEELPLPEGVMIGLICRGKHGELKKHPSLIFPHGKDCILPGDEVTFIGHDKGISSIHQFLGISPRPLKDVTIVGASRTAVRLITILLRKGASVRVIEKDFQSCAWLAEKFPSITVLHHDAADLKFLRSERVDKSSAFVVCSSQNDVNLLVAILAKEVGCENITIGIGDTSYIPIIEKLGIAHVLSSRAIATSRIKTFMRQEMVASIFSLYANQAEIVEIKVSQNSRLIGIPLSEVGPYFPQDFLISAIHSRGRTFIADGKQTFSPGDSVIAITNSKHIDQLQRFF